jgi:predicted metallo-beta-lactamase superfamily hydrolase
MKKLINSCKDCPFLYSDYAPNSTGYSTIDICTLCKYVKNEKCYISIHDGIGFNDKSTTPDWCPLKEEDYTFTFNRQNNKIQDNKNSVKSQIDDVQKLFSKLNDYDDVDSYKNDDEFNELYEKLNNLIDDNQYNIDEDFNNSFKEIKDQLEFIEDQTFKLNETFINLSKELNMDSDNSDDNK